MNVNEPSDESCWVFRRFNLWISSKTEPFPSQEPVGFLKGFNTETGPTWWAVEESPVTWWRCLQNLSSGSRTLSCCFPLKLIQHPWVGATQTRHTCELRLTCTAAAGASRSKQTQTPHVDCKKLYLLLKIHLNLQSYWGRHVLNMETSCKHQRANICEASRLLQVLLSVCSNTTHTVERHSTHSKSNPPPHQHFIHQRPGRDVRTSCFHQDHHPERSQRSS